MNNALKKTKRLAKRLARLTARRPVFVGGIAIFSLALLATSLAVTVFSPKTQPAISLQPASIGIGRGVAACISSGPAVTCDSSGNNVYTLTYDESAHGTGNVYVGIVKVVDTYVAEVDTENSTVPAYHSYTYTLITSQAVPSVGTAQFISSGGYPYGAPPTAQGYSSTYYIAAVSPSQSGLSTGYFYDAKDLPAPLACTPVTWTPYCTGANDPNGNDWQWWEYSNTSPVQYQYIRPGDGTCTPNSTPPPPSPVSASCAPGSTNASISWGASSGAAEYDIHFETTDGRTLSCPSGWTYLMESDGSPICYVDVAAPTQSVAFNPAPGAYSARVFARGTDPSSWNWTLGDAANFTCDTSKPPAPSSFTVSSCSAANQVTLTWSATANTSSYVPSLNIPPGGSCPSGWSDTPLSGGYHGCQTNVSTNAPLTVTVPGNLSIQAAIYAGNAAGYSAPATQTFTCAPPPTASLSANPTKVPTGSASQLTWSSTNATSCTAAGGFSTGGATSGSVNTSPLTTDSTFQVTCTGPGGTSAPAQAKVTVVTPSAVISANPTRVLSGNPTTVSWTATNVSTCNITRNGKAWKSGLAADSDGTVTGSASDPITSQTSYILSCTDAAAKAHAATVVVNVGDGGFQEF